MFKDENEGVNKFCGVRKLLTGNNVSVNVVGKISIKLNFFKRPHFLRK